MSPKEAVVLLGFAVVLWIVRNTLVESFLEALRRRRMTRGVEGQVRAAYLAAMRRARSYAARNACREAQDLLDRALAGEPDAQELARRVGWLVVAAGESVLADTLEYWVEDGADRLRWPDLETDGYKVGPRDPLGKQP